MSVKSTYNSGASGEILLVRRNSGSGLDVKAFLISHDPYLASQDLSILPPNLPTTLRSPIDAHYTCQDVHTNCPRFGMPYAQLKMSIC